MQQRRSPCLEQPATEFEREKHMLEIAFTDPLRVIEENALDVHGLPLCFLTGT